MKLVETGISGLVVIEPDVFGDERGYFMETWNMEKFKQMGILTQFVQDNESLSSYGVMRGLHYQLNPFAQAKLVRAVRGAVYDVAVDIRKGSPTFGKYFGVELSEENKRMMLIPVGFEHGFSVISDKALFSYKCSGLYNKEAERGINILDPDLGIDWNVSQDRAIISAKDKDAPNFKNAEYNFTY